jgi:predicted lipoprotein with Yx(FWY)xxD motif
MTRTRSLLALGVCAAVLAAGAVFARSAPAGSTSAAAARASVVVSASRFGRILFDGRGYALYAFTRDPRNRATCYGACAKAWPPFLVTARPAAARGARASLVGTVRRRDGRLQATYGGRPLYYYVGDNAPGVILCQNVKEFGGYWLVVRGTGALVR